MAMFSLPFCVLFSTADAQTSNPPARTSSAKSFSAEKAKKLESVFSDNALYGENFFEEAKKLAAKEKRKIMLLFSGVEWCGPCKYFEKDIMQNRRFKSYAKKNLIIINVDTKATREIEIKVNGTKVSGTPAELSKYAKDLRSKYRYSGVPTVFIVDSTGKVLVQHVGSGITPQAFINKIK